MKYIRCKTIKEKREIITALPWSAKLAESYSSIYKLLPALKNYEIAVVDDAGVLGTFYSGRHSSADSAIPFRDWKILRDGKDPEVLKGHLRLMSALGRIPEAAGCIKTIKANPNALVAPSVETDGKYSYARSKADKHDSKRRVKTSLQKILRKLGNEEPDHILAKAAGDLYPLLWPSPVKILKGYDICEFYYNNRDSLPSCMTDKNDTEMYAVSPCCSLAVYEKDGVGLARCMVFDTDQGVKVHSRIYFSGGHQENKGVLLEYFEKNGIKNAYQNERDYSITCTIPDSGFVPYMDTFRYTDDEPYSGAEVTFKESGDYEACCTNGGIEGPDRCVNCSHVGHDLSHWNDEHYCDDCLDEITFTCDHCGYRRDNDGMQTVDEECWCSRCVENYASFCNHCREYHSDSTSTNLDEQEQWCDSCIERAGLTYVSCCSGYTANAVEVDGESYCEGCAPKKEEGEPVRPEGELGECCCIEEPALSEAPRPRTAEDLRNWERIPTDLGWLKIVDIETRRTHEPPQEVYLNSFLNPAHSGWIKEPSGINWGFTHMTVAVTADCVLEPVYPHCSQAVAV